MKFTMTKIATGLVLALASSAAMAVVPVNSSGVFNMLSQDGLDLVGDGVGAPINVDTGISAWVDQSAGTWGVSSPNIFFGLPWTASNGNLISTAGSYSMNVVTGAVSAGTGVTGADGIMNFNVAAGQMAGTIDLAYGTTTGIRVINVWDVNMDGSLTAVGVPGMENGPFPGFNAAFNLNLNDSGICVLTWPCAYPPGEWPGLPVPEVPEAETYAMMLAGLGLVGFVARRRKQAAA